MVDPTVSPDDQLPHLDTIEGAAPSVHERGPNPDADPCLASRKRANPGKLFPDGA